MKGLPALLFGGIIGIIAAAGIVTYTPADKSTTIVEQLTTSGCIPIVLKHNPEVKIIEMVCYYGDL